MTEPVSPKYVPSHIRLDTYSVSYTDPDEWLDVINSLKEQFPNAEICSDFTVYDDYIDNMDIYAREDNPLYKEYCEARTKFHEDVKLYRQWKLDNKELATTIERNKKIEKLRKEIEKLQDLN